MILVCWVPTSNQPRPYTPQTTPPLLPCRAQMCRMKVVGRMCTGVGPLLPDLPGTPRGAGGPPAGSPGGPWGAASPTFTAADSALAESSDQLREMKEALRQRELYLKGLQRQLEEVINSERTPRPSPEPSPAKHGAAAGPE
mmetsp:Transcript_121114/g.387829  ORF Transcript_121114/g.387829 Transcript_121114/m.387829 type:complete len:141 (+) Transcript_121114:2-424(+)